MKKRLSFKTIIFIFVLIIVCVVMLVRCNEGRAVVPAKATTETNTPDSLAFGDTKFIGNGLEGKVYLLPEGTPKLPDFDTLNSVGSIYTRKLDIPVRSWTSGFPGVTDRFEWFAIRYKGDFRVKTPGHYRFRIMSDDGARLFIDGKMIVDNDGVHGPGSREGEADIDGSRHSIEVQYFQGPRTEIALQLFATLDKEEEKVFPGDNFTLITPGSDHTWTYIIISISVLIFIAVYVYVRTRMGARMVRA